MARTCTKCKTGIPDGDELHPQAEKYPCCNKCWHDWQEYRTIVMNEMKLDMSVADHRKLIKKQEKVFAGVLTTSGDVIDFSKDENRRPDEPTDQKAP